MHLAAGAPGHTLLSGHNDLGMSQQPQGDVIVKKIHGLKFKLLPANSLGEPKGDRREYEDQHQRKQLEADEGEHAFVNVLDIHLGRGHALKVKKRPTERWRKEAGL